ncbi:MAG: AI-2E family transporter [Candidatus Moranbacteria bacterium]|nr:AI-2E family transporter [Candidatus Moranbacteria bacterium]
MELKNFNVNFFLLVLLGISVLTFLILQPFLIAIILAAILAVIFQRPFNFFLRISGDRRKISAFATALLGIIIFGGIFIGIISLVFTEVSSLFQQVSSQSGAYDQRYLDHLVSNINSNQVARSFGLDNFINKETVGKSISQLGQEAVVIFQKTYQSIVNFMFLTIVMFFTLYYFLIGGKDLVRKIMYLSPLRDSHEKILIEKFISMSRATIKGTLMIGVLQGTIGGLLFAAVGIHSAVVWGVVMMFLSLIPMFGTGLVWLPAGVIMLLLGNIWQGVTIILVGMGIISTVDNFLKPKLVGKDTQMHPLIVFFATLGGISLLGFLGFIIGPIIVALCITLWDIYAVEFKKQLRKYNE